MPRERGRFHRKKRPARRVRRTQRIAREQMLDIGENQLLMLLLVMQAEQNQRDNLPLKFAR